MRAVVTFAGELTNRRTRQESSSLFTSPPSPSSSTSSSTPWSRNEEGVHVYARASSGISQSAHAVTRVGKCRAGEEAPRLRHPAGVAAIPTSRCRNKVRAAAAAACTTLPAFSHPSEGGEWFHSGSIQSKMRLLLLLLLLLLQAEGCTTWEQPCIVFVCPVTAHQWCP